MTDKIHFTHLFLSNKQHKFQIHITLLYFPSLHLPCALIFNLSPAAVETDYCPLLAVCVTVCFGKIFQQNVKLFATQHNSSLTTPLALSHLKCPLRRAFNILRYFLWHTPVKADISGKDLCALHV